MICGLLFSSREQKEKQEAKDRYWKVTLGCCLTIIFFLSRPIQLHVQGKTQEAKADLSRLAKIRAERDAAQAKRKAEADGLYSHPRLN